MNAAVVVPGVSSAVTPGRWVTGHGRQVTGNGCGVMTERVTWTAGIDDDRILNSTRADFG